MYENGLCARLVNHYLSFDFSVTSFSVLNMCTVGVVNVLGLKNGHTEN